MAREARSVNRYTQEMFLRIPKYIKKVEILNVDVPKYLGNGNSFSGNIIAFGLANIFKKYDLVHNFYFNVGMHANITLTTVYDLREFKGTFVDAWAARQWFKSDYLIAISSQTAKELIQKGYPKNRIFTVNIGINDEFLKKGKKKPQNKVFKIGCISSFEKNKNIVNTVKAIKTHIFKLKYEFDFYGPGGTEENAIKNEIGKTPYIHIMGYIPMKKIVETYDSFDAFIFPSLYEGFGLPILEAQARGVPVIILKRAVIPKEVRKYCFEAEDLANMMSIIENIKERGYNEKLRNNATEYARSFTWKECAKETLEVYKDILQK